MSSLDVRLLSMHWKNIRAMMDMDAPPKEGEKYCDFPPKKGYVIQMPNGSGKTTTLNLLEHVITGVVPSVEEAREYRRAVGGEKSARFIDSTSVFIARFLVNDEKWGIELVMNHQNEEVEFVTQTPNKGKRNGWHMPLAFRQAFYRKRRLAKLVAFDAETARTIIEESDKELLRDAIRQFGGYAEVHRLVGSPSVGGVYSGGRFDTVKSEIQGSIGKLKGKDKDIGGKQKRAERCLKEAKKSKRALLGMVKNDELSIQQCTEKISDLRKRKEDEFKGMESQLEELKQINDDLGNAISQRSDRTQKLLDTLLNPQNVLIDSWNDIVSFHQTHRDQKLPEEVGKGWLEEMARGEVCICGRKINGDIRDHILSNIQDHLDAGKLIAVAAVQGAFVDSSSSDFTAVQYAQASLEDIEANIDDLTTTIESSISEGLTKEAKDEMDRIDAELETLVDDLSDHEYGLEIRTTKDFVWLRGEQSSQGLKKNSNVVSEDEEDIENIQNLIIAENVIEHFEAKLAEMSGAGVELRGLNLTRGVVGAALDELNDRLRSHVSERAGAMWKGLPPAKRDKGLTMSIGDQGMRFWRGSSPQKKVSGAQGVTACYSAATAICRIGDYSVPLVADTPFAGWDDDIIPEWEDTVISLFDQWVVLVNKGEAKDMIMMLWNDNFPPEGVYLSSMVEYDKSEEDEGRMLRFSEDTDIFKSMAGVGN